MEEYYLVCLTCGEAFHASVHLNQEPLTHQHDHQLNAPGEFEGWEIQPESEAM